MNDTAMGSAALGQKELQVAMDTLAQSQTGLGSESIIGQDHSLAEPLSLVAAVLPRIGAFAAPRTSGIQWKRRYSAAREQSAPFSGVRAYAVSYKNILVTLIVVVLGLFPAGSTVVVLAGVDNCQLLPRYRLHDKCINLSKLLVQVPASSAVVTSVGLGVSEALVLVVILVQTWRTIRLAHNIGHRMSFTALILREGILYFAPIPILVSRFYFNLDELENAEPTWTLPSAALEFAENTTSSFPGTTGQRPSSRIPRL
ncbi:hypothetical protein OH77DRAFT_1432891 [Trametes cingulata]|nr:hypothetical protein OH77DRAFT_1432891 [Trametes cingulata]